MRVLIIEDLVVVQKLLNKILSDDPDIEVVGVASNGKEGLEMARKLHPDVILTDINMPLMNGFEVTRSVMETDPVPVVIVSASWDPKDVETTFLAVEAGAVAVLDKPRGVNHPDFQAMVDRITETTKAMSEVKVVRRWSRSRRRPAAGSADPAAATPAPPAIEVDEPEIVVIGASVGGPPVVQQILQALPADLPVPVVVIQHISEGFMEGLVNWLASSCPIPVQIAGNGEALRPGHVYLPPDGFHLKISAGKRASLTEYAKIPGPHPSVAHLFGSVAEVYGSHSVGVLLSGMGRDGAAELRAMKDRGALTLAQSEETCIVFGMPGEAIRLGGATHVLSPEAIASAINQSVCGSRRLG